MACHVISLRRRRFATVNCVYMFIFIRQKDSSNSMRQRWGKYHQPSFFVLIEWLWLLLTINFRK